MDDLTRSVGKRIHGAIYVHVSASSQLNESERKLLQQAQGLAQELTFTPSVFKIELRSRRVSLLLYEDFDTEPFPALLEAVSVEVGSARVTSRSYRDSTNPPILHRKELLLTHDHPRCEVYEALTSELEQRGLFVDATRIGHRRQWGERLEAAGVKIIDHTVIEVS